MCLLDTPMLTFWSLKPNARTQVAGLYESPDSGGVFSCTCAFVFLFISLPHLQGRFSLSNTLRHPFTVLLVLISIYYLVFIPQVKVIIVFDDHLFFTRYNQPYLISIPLPVKCHFDVLPTLEVPNLFFVLIATNTWGWMHTVLGLGTYLAITGNVLLWTMFLMLFLSCWYAPRSPLINLSRR